jgi:hypothetical protein
MRRILSLVMLSSLLFGLVATPLHAQSTSGPKRGPSTEVVVAGLGAVAGVVAFNAVALGMASLPGGAAYLGAATIPAEMGVAVSRVYAVSSAVGGAWLADYVYTPSTDNADVSGRALAMGTGAIASVAIFNSMTATLGVVPLAGAALDPVPLSTVLGSRLIAVTTAGLGAIGATWAYDTAVGNQTDFGYMFTLLGGALGGVGLANYLSMDMIGIPPLTPGSGYLYYGAVVADAATSTASRFWVVGSGVMGAMVADWWYRR